MLQLTALAELVETLCAVGLVEVLTPILKLLVLTLLLILRLMLIFLKYDSVLGQLDGVDIQYTDDTFVINNKTIKCFSDRNPLNLPWKEWGVDLVIESTGVFNTDVGASKHLEVGAKKVILTAPGKGAGVGTYVVGVNADNT